MMLLDSISCPTVLTAAALTAGCVHVYLLILCFKWEMVHVHVGERAHALSLGYKI